jgi:ankyrin repeat protein
VVEILLRHDACVGAKDGDANTALHWAAYNDHIECLRVLLAHGADAQETGFDGKTALMMAEERKHSAAAEILRKAVGV